MELLEQGLAQAGKTLNTPLLHLGKTEIDLFTIVYVLFSSLVLIAVTRRCKRWISSYILGKAPIDVGTREAVASIAGYLVIGFGLILILQSAGIDLSALTVFAGAVGLGLSFGLQNVVSNFVSGIIILFERPIKVGDRVEVSGVIGDVVKISLRATIIRTNENIDIIVPNSDFITQKVTNLTYENRNLRVKVPVGVSYGADSSRVQQIMLSCANEHPGVLADPPPAVMLERFGDSSLDFALFVSTEEYLAKTLILRSDLNLAILEKFRAEGVEIPFPQRDIHIKSTAGVFDQPALP